MTFNTIAKIMGMVGIYIPDKKVKQLPKYEIDKLNRERVRNKKK